MGKNLPLGNNLAPRGEVKNGPLHALQFSGSEVAGSGSVRFAGVPELDGDVERSKKIKRILTKTEEWKKLTVMRADFSF
jgi:hypothetical protein